MSFKHSVEGRGLSPSLASRRQHSLSPSPPASSLSAAPMTPSNVTGIARRPLPTLIFLLLLLLVGPAAPGALAVQLRGLRGPDQPSSRHVPTAPAGVEEPSLLQTGASNGGTHEARANLYGGLYRIRAKGTSLYLDSTGATDGSVFLQSESHSGGEELVTRPFRAKTEIDPTWMSQLWLLEEGLPNSYSMMQYSSGNFLEATEDDKLLLRPVGSSKGLTQQRSWFLQGSPVSEGEVDLETLLLSASSLRRAALSLVSERSDSSREETSTVGSEERSSNSRKESSSSSTTNTTNTSSSEGSAQPRADLLERFVTASEGGLVSLAPGSQATSNSPLWVLEKVESVPEALADGVYLLQNAQSGRNLAASAPDRYESHCETRAAAVENSQHWILRRTLGEVYTLQQGVSGQLLGNRGGEVLTSLWSDAERESQTFRLWRVSYDQFLLLHSSGGTTFAVEALGSQVSLKKATAASFAGNVTSQIWKFRKSAALPALDGLYHLRQKTSGQFLSIQPNGELSLVTSVFQTSSSTSQSQAASSLLSLEPPSAPSALAFSSLSARERSTGRMQMSQRQRQRQRQRNSNTHKSSVAPQALAPSPAAAAQEVEKATVWRLLGLEGDELEISSEESTPRVLGISGTSETLPKLVGFGAMDSVQHWFAEKLDSSSYALRLANTSRYLDTELLKDGSVQLLLAKRSSSDSQAWELVEVGESSLEHSDDGTAYLSVCPSFFACGTQDDWSGGSLTCGPNADGSCSKSNALTTEKHKCTEDHSCQCVPKAACEGECGEEDDGCGGKIMCGHYGECQALDASGQTPSCYPKQKTIATLQRSYFLTVGKCCAPTASCESSNFEHDDCWHIDDGCGKILTCGDCEASTPAPAPAPAPAPSLVPSPVQALPANWRCTQDGCHCIPSSCENRCGQLDDGCGGPLECSCDDIANAYCFEAEHRCIVISAATPSKVNVSSKVGEVTKKAVTTTTTTTIDYLPAKATIENMYNYLYYFFFYYQYLSLQKAKVPKAEATARSALLARAAAMDTLRGELNKMVPTTTTTIPFPVMEAPSNEATTVGGDPAPAPAPAPAAYLGSSPAPSPGPVSEAPMNATTRQIGSLLWDSLITRHSLFDSSAVPEMLENLRYLAEAPFSSSSSSSLPSSSAASSSASFVSSSSSSSSSPSSAASLLQGRAKPLDKLAQKSAGHRDFAQRKSLPAAEEREEEEETSELAVQRRGVFSVVQKKEAEDPKRSEQAEEEAPQAATQAAEQESNDQADEALEAAREAANKEKTDPEVITLLRSVLDER